MKKIVFSSSLFKDTTLLLWETPEKWSAHLKMDFIVFYYIMYIFQSMLAWTSNLHAGVGVEEHDTGEGEHLFGDAVAGPSEVR